jgi:hypothetical protein
MQAMHVLLYCVLHGWCAHFESSASLLPLLLLLLLLLLQST